MRRTTLVLAMVALVFALVPTAAGAAQSAGATESYIVVLSSGDPGEVASEHSRRHEASVRQVYRHALRGYAARMSARAAANIAGDPRVAYVERDQVAHTFSQQVPTGVRRILADGNTNIGINGSDDARVNVDVAIIDTGLDSDHPDLNIAGGVDCATGGPFNRSCKVGTFEDGNGHGTHVGGTVAAIDNGLGVVGVAPGARLWGVRVLDNNGSGYMSWIVAGIDWVTKNAATIEVANMSLGCECTSTAMNDGIRNSVAAGVVYAVAAGNSDKDAATFSPANHPDVITVSALADFNGLAGGGATPTCRTDQDDTLADFSNFGSHVELTAPGVCIASTWLNGGYHTISGTSMASPHVAGAAALLASSASTASKSDVDAIRKTLVDKGNFNWTDDSGDGIKEPLLDVSNTTVFNPATTSTGGGDGSTNNTPPTASFTYSCSDLTCSFDGSGSTDSDGSINSYLWNFGNGLTATGETATHTYAAGGTYTVTLTVTDDKGATGTETQSVTVTKSGTGFSLSVSGYKVKGVQHADLTWSGATSTNVDVYRDGARIATTANDGAHTDNIGTKGGGSYTYKVCEAGTSTCSNEATVTF